MLRRTLVLPRHLRFLAAKRSLATTTDTAKRLALNMTNSDLYPPSMASTHHRPFLLADPLHGATDENCAGGGDWTQNVELDVTQNLLKSSSSGTLRVLVLYGSLRERSYSKLMSFEAARILHRLGCDVRVFDPAGLPVKDEVSSEHPKVQELRRLSDWSEAQFWCSPEQHGNLTAVFKNQIDWLPLAIGSVRPTQGRTLALAQVNGGSQSFNTVNALRILGRWMRMFVIPNQASLPMAWKAFTAEGRLLPSSNRNRLVDVCEELVKMSVILRPHSDLLVDRFSERLEKRDHGRLRTQEETVLARPRV